MSPGRRKGATAAAGRTGSRSSPKTHRGEVGSLRAPASKRARPSLRLPKEHYRLLFERDLAGIYRTTLSGKILECNESFAKMLGYASSQELLRMSASDLYIRKADRKAFLKKLLAAGFMRNAGLVLRRKDGSPIHVLENVSLVADASGRRRIIQGTMIDVSDLRRAERALRESERKHRKLAGDLRRLNHHLQVVREEERDRIAHEMHDELGQLLTALKLDLHWLARKADGFPPAVRERTQAMADLVDRTLQTVRRICTDLHPTIVCDLGLGAAVEWLVCEFKNRTGIRCELTLPRAFSPLPDEQAGAIYRILQECLTNIARHASAGQAVVVLKEERGALRLSVSDDGIGIARGLAADPNSFGLASMRERTIQWGGKIRIASRPGRGTTVTVLLPLARAGAGAQP